MVDRSDSLYSHPHPQRDTDHRDDYKRLLEDSLAETQPVKVSPSSALPDRAGAPQGDLGITQPVRPVRAARLPISAAAASPTRRLRQKFAGDDTRPLRVARKSGLWADAMRRLARNPEAVFGIVIITLFILVAIFASWIAPYSIRDINFDKTNLPPFWVERSKLGFSGDINYLLGTDRYGRDLLSWAIIGTRTSMIVGVVSAPIIALFGLLVGLLAGYVGGRLDNLIMRITDVFYAFPTLMITIILVLALRDTELAKLQNGLLILFITFLSVGWVGAARLVRGSVMVIKGNEYIEAARCIGAPAPRLIFRHILPNCLGPLLVWVTLMIPQLILMEAILGYLQINIGPYNYREAFFDASWGGMIREGRGFIHVQPMTILIPAACIGMISIAFTFLGDALRDALDPQNNSHHHANT